MARGTIDTANMLAEASKIQQRAAARLLNLRVTYSAKRTKIEKLGDELNVLADQIAELEPIHENNSTTVTQLGGTPVSAELITITDVAGTQTETVDQNDAVPVS